MGGPGPHADLTENWDDDFEFQSVNEGHFSQLRGSVPKEDAVMSLLQDKKNTLKSDFNLWAEPGPSTPSKRAHLDTENWDDDFQDNTDSPLRPQDHNVSPRSRRRRQTIQDAENWDDDFEDDKHASPSKAARWESSSDEELGFGDREEDKTVTSRTRRSGALLVNDSPPPPVPPLPALFHTDAQPFPRSPTASVFSVPVSGRDSVAGHSYSSTAHLALRPTQSSSSFSHLPPSPPTHHARERRRLRKKSRPPRVDDNIYELEDRSEIPMRPVTPERSMSPPRPHNLEDPVVDPTPPSAGRNSLVSKIGSVGKKWGASRKKRASTGPAEVALSERSKVSGHLPTRPMSMAIPTSQSSPKGWFFRHGGDPGAGSGSPPNNVSALPLKHEKSVDRFLSLVGFDHDTPSKRKHKIRQGLPPDLTSIANNRSSLVIETSPRKPSIQSSSSSSARPVGSRNASYGGRQTPSSRESSVPRSASASVDDVTSKRMSRVPSSNTHEGDFRTPRKSRSSADQELGGRGIMGGMRKISLSGKHKRSRASMAVSENEEPVRPSTSTTATVVPNLPWDNATDVTPRPPSRIMARFPNDAPLLPPIELQPPSPPRALNALSQPFMEQGSSPMGIDTIFESTTTSSLPSSHSGTVTALQRSILVPSTPSTISKLPASSPQSASLGRATHLPKEKDDEVEAVPRRSSLGDLKIPARISQAQVGLRRDLGMVRDFANSVEQLRELQTAYYGLAVDVQTLIVDTAPPEQHASRVTSPTLFGLPLPGYRTRSNTNPQSSKSVLLKQIAEHHELSAAYHAIESKYQLSWECAELLIELGGGTPAQPPSAISSLHADRVAVSSGRKSRERAITLAGDETNPQVPDVTGAQAPAVNPSISAQWRASTGRHDLSQRQLHLLRDMLHNPSSSESTDDQPPEDVNRAWHWGDAMGSTVTLPSEYSSHHGSTSVVSHQLTGQKRKSGRLGMRALRDMLRSLKKTQSAVQPMPVTPQPISASSASVAYSTTSSLNLASLPIPPDPSVNRRPRAKTSTGPESVKSLREHPNSPYVTSASLHHKLSPRRPSLASLFKLGQKGKSATVKSSPSSDSRRELSIDDLPAGSSSSCQATNDDEDWDQVEYGPDLEAIIPVSASGSDTVRKRKGPAFYTPHDARTPSSSTQSSKANPSSSQVSVVSFNPPSTPSRARSQLPPLPTELGTAHSHPRSTKLSDVKEYTEPDGEAPRRVRRSLSKRKRQSYAGPSTRRPSSRGGKGDHATGSLRSPPPQLWPGTLPPDLSPGPTFTTLPENGLMLAMTPENIRPLLENAKDVYSRCSDCIGELKQLLATHPRPS